MKINPALVFTAALLMQAWADPSATSFDSPNATLTGWTIGVTGKGEAKWTIEKDTSAPSGTSVLKQSGVADYPVILKNDPVIKDGFVEVKGKAISGSKDQAIGVVWRARDLNNYYVCRANALEDNVVLYKVVNGKRSPLDIIGRSGGYGLDAKVEPQKWHTMRVEFSGDTFKVIWNGKELFQVKDASLTEAGKTGLWTKADSVVVFDDFTSASK